MIRKLKFIAWDTKNHLIKRLGKVELIKGELKIPGHIILQFTGYVDKLGKEVYEDDILLSNGEEKVMVVWSIEKSGWTLKRDTKIVEFDANLVKHATRLYNKHEK